MGRRLGQFIASFFDDGIRYVPRNEEEDVIETYQDNAAQWAEFRGTRPIPPWLCAHCGQPDCTDNR